jgi:hypothetical protein
MEFKKAKKGTFGQMVYCPVCKETLYEQGVKVHILAKARNELWRKEFYKATPTRHLHFVKKNMQVIKQQKFTLKIK